MSIRFSFCKILSWRRAAAMLLVFTSFWLGGCGVVSKQTLKIESEPKGAFVYVNGKFVGNSPLGVRLNRQVPHQVELRKVGFLSDQVMVYPSVPEGGEPAVMFGPLRESGVYRDLDPNPVSVELVYEELQGLGGELSDAQAEALILQIEAEREVGELTDAEAALALSQVQARMAGSILENLAEE